MAWPAAAGRWRRRDHGRDVVASVGKRSVAVAVNYDAFLASKSVRHVATGLADPQPAHAMLFDFQRDIVRWALRKGRAAVFADCGTGKTFMQLEWAKQVPGRVLILAPLAVAPQTVREGRKLGIDVTYSRKPCDARITITNYEMLEH